MSSTRSLYLRGSGDEAELWRTPSNRSCPPASRPRPGAPSSMTSGPSRAPSAGAQAGPPVLRDPRALRGRLRHLQHVHRDRGPAPCGRSPSCGDRCDPEADQALPAVRGPRRRPPGLRARRGRGCRSRPSCSSPSSMPSGWRLPGQRHQGRPPEVIAGVLHRHDHHLRLGDDPGPPGRPHRADRGAAGRCGRDLVVSRRRVITAVVLVGAWVRPACSSAGTASVGLGALALVRRGDRLRARSSPSAGRGCSSPCCHASGSKVSSPSTTRLGTRSARRRPRTRCSSASSSSPW